MYRVLFAEDELLVRLGLQNSIPWESFGMELAGEADNGLIAYKMFKELKPDIVITDIKMDGMDGYELIRKIREIDSKCAIVIITCLDDFDALRKMMGFRIMGYILKASMTMQEISNIMGQVKEYLDYIYQQKPKFYQKKAAEKDEILKYLKGEECGQQISWKSETGFFKNEIAAISMLKLKSTDQGKINDLAMKLIHELLKQWLSGCYVLQTDTFEVLIFTNQTEKCLTEDFRHFDTSVTQFLGVNFNRVTVECNQKTFPEIYAELKEKFELVESQDINMNIIIQQAVDYLKENYQKPLTLPKIAKKFGLSPSYLSYLFKKETGKNYVDFLTELRLMHVLSDLKTSKDKIQVVAERNGFSNLEYFSRFFKKKTGTSPAKWRQEHC